MTREIKFRAKSLDGIWEYGELHLKNCNHPHIHNLIGAKIYIDPNTVGQFTGLHDKNGKEIYEGDIVRTLVSRLNATKNKKYRNFVIRYDAPHFWNGYDTLLMSEFRMEVIGNIHDNPELLKGGEV